MPPVICAGMAKIFILRLRGYPGLRFIFMKFRHRDGSAKVRYMFTVSVAGENFQYTTERQMCLNVSTNPDLMNESLTCHIPNYRISKEELRTQAAQGKSVAYHMQNVPTLLWGEEQ